MKRSNHDLAHINWLIPAFLLVVWAPLGIVVGILKLLDMHAERQEQEQRRNWSTQFNADNSQYSSQQSTSSAPYRANSVYGTQQSQKSKYDYSFTYNYEKDAAAQSAARKYPHTQTSTSQRVKNSGTTARTTTSAADNMSEDQSRELKKQKRITTLLYVAAVIALVIGIPTLLDGFDYTFYDAAFHSWGFFDYLLPGALQTAAGVGLIFCGRGSKKKLNEEKLLVTIIGSRDNATISELSRTSGFDRKKTKKLIKEAIGHGLLGSAAFLDEGTETVVVRGPAPSMQKEAEEKKQAAAAAAAQAKSSESEYDRLLRELHEINEEIPGEAMTAKITELEKISARIFDLAEKDPSKKAMLSRFMDYYLPTAKKLLTTYAKLDKQGVEGENISEAKRTIEDSMDTLIHAFELQLDKLFEADAMDVSTDVAALNGMLSMDGLTDSDFDFSSGSTQSQNDPGPFSGSAT